MPTATKRGKKWRARASIDGKQVGAGSYKTKAEALQAALEKERAAKAGNYAGVHGKIVRDVLDRYAEEVSPHKRGAKWEVARLRALSRCGWARLPADRLTPDALGKHRDERLKTVSGATVIREFNLLSAVFQRAVKEWKWMNSNPLHDVRRPPDSQARTRIATDQEIAAICLAAGYRIGSPAVTATARTAAAFVFSVETGMRASEILGLRLEHIRHSVAVLPKTKNGHARQVPLSAKSLEVLRDIGHSFGLTSPQRDALWRKIRNRAGIKGLTFHDARATAVTRLAKQLDILDLARMIGHKNLGQLQTYYRESAEDIAKKLA